MESAQHNPPLLSQQADFTANQNVPMMNSATDASQQGNYLYPGNLCSCLSTPGPKVFGLIYAFPLSVVMPVGNPHVDAVGTTCVNVLPVFLHYLSQWVCIGMENG